MRDIPVFTTEYGAASLALKEVPTRQEAYVTVLSAQPGQEKPLLEECASFCRMAGASRVYARLEDGMDYPLHCAVLRMRGRVPPEPPADHLWPVTAETAGRWREVYNRAMAGVDNAATMTSRDEERIVSSHGAYFVHDGGKLLGIGWIEEGQLLAIAGEGPGLGERVLRTLLSVCTSEQVTLEVASTNFRAIRLYERLGFITVGEVSRWYKIL